MLNKQARGRMGNLREISATIILPIFCFPGVQWKKPCRGHVSTCMWRWGTSPARIWTPLFYCKRLYFNCSRQAFTVQYREVHSHSNWFCFKAPREVPLKFPSPRWVYHLLPWFLKESSSIFPVKFPTADQYAPDLLFSKEYMCKFSHRFK